jgi:hypothetical protein
MVGTPSVEDAQRFRKSRDVQLSGVAAHVVVSDRISEGGQKSRPLSPHHRFVIAMHSPDGVLESGLLGCLPEKKVAKACLQDWAGHFLRSALRERFAQLRGLMEPCAPSSSISTRWLKQSETVILDFRKLRP